MSSSVSAPVGSAFPTDGAVPTAAAPANAAEALPPPAAERSLDDPLGRMLMLMSRMSQTSMNETAMRIDVNQGQMDQAFEEFLTKLRDAIRAAEARKDDDDGGLFGFVSDFCDAVVNLVVDVGGDLFGTSADFIADLATAPFDLLAGLIQGGNLFQLLSQELGELGSDGEVAGKVMQFSEGVSRFLMDVQKFMMSHVAVLEAGLRGENVWDAFVQQGEHLYDSFLVNVVQNPAVWEVTSFVLKATAVVSTAISGGALAPFAVGLVLLSEIDKRYDVAEKLLGSEWGGIVSTGLEVGASLLLFYACADFDGLGNMAELAANVQHCTSIVAGLSLAVAVIENYKNELERAAALERDAAIEEAWQRVETLQRLIEVLIATLEDKTENDSQLMQRAGDVYQTRGMTYEAGVMRA